MKENITYLIALFISCIAIAQDGNPDVDFGTNGIVITSLENPVDAVFGLDQNTDGKTLVIGQRFVVLGQDTNFIASYFADGAIDTSFGNNGFIITSSEFQGNYRNIAFQANEHFLVSNNQSVLRFLQDGTEDTSFGNNGSLTPFIANNGEFGDFHVTEDLSILVQGTAPANNQLTYLILKKYLDDGTIDITFGENGSVYYPINTSQNFRLSYLSETSNNKIVVGYTITANGVKNNFVVRFLENGDLDTTFGEEGRIILPIEDTYGCTPIALSNGAVISGCSFWDPNLQTVVYKTLKVLNDGSLDTSFAENGYLLGESAIIVQPNQRFITADHSVDFEGGVIINHKRYFPNGVLDTSFNFSTNHTELQSYEVILTKNGKLLSAGNDIWYNGPDINLVLQQHNNDNALSVQDIALQNITVTPNPSSGLYRIHNPSLNNSELPYEIYDSSGKQIKQGILYNREAIIDLKKERNGLYFIKIDTTVLKIIKS